MEPEEAVQVDRGSGARTRPWYSDGRPQVVVGPLAVRHHNVQTVGGAALKNCHQNLLPRPLAGIQGPLQPEWRTAGTKHGEGRITEKNSTSTHACLNASENPGLRGQCLPSE